MSANSAGQFANEFIEIVEQELDDLTFHQDKAAHYKSILIRAFGTKFTENLLNPAELPDLRRAVERSVELGFDQFDSQQLKLKLLDNQIQQRQQHLANQRLRLQLMQLKAQFGRANAIGEKVNCSLGALKQHNGELSKQLTANRQQVTKEISDAKKFAESAAAAESHLQSVGYSDNLNHSALMEKCVANQHLAGDKQRLLDKLEEFDGLAPDLAAARQQLEDLRRQVELAEQQVFELYRNEFN